MGFIKRLVDWWESGKQEEEEFNQLVERLEQEYASEIEPLSLEEARARAERLMADPTRFHCTMATERGSDALEVLAPLVREFFRTYDEVRQLPGDLILARTAIKPSCVAPGMMVIGSSGKEFTHLAVRPRQETVYELSEERSYGDEELPAWWFPSVYHCIVFFDRYQALLFSE